MASKSRILAVGVALTVVAVLLVVAGPILSEQSRPASPEGSATDGSRAPQEASITLSADGLDEYSFDGSTPPTLQIKTDVYIYGHESFRYEDAQVCLYDAGGELLGQSSLGPVVSPESGEFFRRYTRNVTVSEKPKYVIVDHPQIRNDSRFATDTLIWKSEDSIWGVTWSDLNSVQDEFQWPQTNETGECG